MQEAPLGVEDAGIQRLGLRVLQLSHVVRYQSLQG